MRPLKLTMTAFGPYAGAETIDFRRLGDSAFFLIHGPTGSGKTTILDAMCFALFGKTSGELRDGKQMRSDYVDPGSATEVIFDFSLGGEVYRVLRRPEQEVRKKRGSGTTKMLSSATLWKRTGLADDALEGTVMAARWEKVTETAENLLGFRYEQFRQVVMLPQGEFRRLLLASSKDREAILETLFQTELYRRIEEYFKAQAKELAEAVKGLTAQKKWTLDQAGVATVEELALQLAEDNRLSLELAVSAASAQQTLQAAQDKFNAAKLLKAQFEDRRQAEKHLSGLKEQEPRIAAKRLELFRAQQAQGLAEIASHAALRQAEAEAADAKLQQAAGDLTEALTAARQAEEKLRAEQERDKEREEAAQLVHQLTQLQIKATQLAAARADCVQAGQIAQIGLDVYEKLKINLRQTTDALQEQRKNRDRLQLESAQLTARRAVYEHAAQMVAHRQRREELLRAYRRVEQAEKAAGENFAAAEKTLAAARRELDIAQTRWRQNQAAELASKLAEGQPCPVCGSSHHPAPAHGAAATLSALELEDRQRLVQKLEQELETLRQPLTGLTVEKSIIETEGKNLRQLLGDKAEQELAVLRSLAAQAQIELSAAEAAAGGFARAEQMLTELESAVKTLQGETEEAENNVRRQKAAHEAAKAVVAERESAVPENLRDPERLSAELEQAARRRDLLQQAWLQARQLAESAALQTESCRSAHTGASERAAAAQKQLLAEKSKLAFRIDEAGFSGEEDFKAAIRPRAIADSLEQEIKAYDQLLLLAEDRVKRAIACTDGLAEPDLQAAGEVVREALAASDRLVAAQAALQEHSRKRQHCLDDIRRIDNELTDRERDYALLGRLAEVANGQNPLRISFHRFVLATLLDDVMLAANIRLKKMSRGRYGLRRMTDPLHRGAAGGLDIEIEDNYTGACRHVATLSGGETFLASLSLALGLADVVQSFSGGIYLDTIFVDEGFGTLDPESLDMAVQALIELRHKGRLVGIISHVPELKERIEARLEIIPTERGSTTRWSALPPAAQQPAPGTDNREDPTAFYRQ